MLKSLEIVDKYIEEINKKIDFAYSKMNREKQDNFIFDFQLKQIKFYKPQLNELELIKQDLEVLEIIRKKKIDVGFIKAMLENYSIEEALEAINDCSYRKLTTEELKKLKQWLKSNKVGEANV